MSRVRVSIGVVECVRMTLACDSRCASATAARLTHTHTPVSTTAETYTPPPAGMSFRGATEVDNERERRRASGEETEGHEERQGVAFKRHPDWYPCGGHDHNAELAKLCGVYSAADAVKPAGECM